MDNAATSKSFIPQTDGQALDFIKICAAVFMVIDHINTSLLGSTQPAMFLLGRAVFPLFCYALAMSLFRVGPEKMPRYAIRRIAPRLLILAVITEPIAQLSRDIGPMGNVLFTLGFGALVAGLTCRFKDWHIAALCLLSLLPLYFMPLIEFSTAGVMLPAAFLLVLRGRKIGYACVFMLLACINLPVIGNITETVTSQDIMGITLTAAATIITPIALIRYAASQPQTGRYLPKYFLHVFYPLHLAIIGIVHYWITTAGN